MSYKVVPHSWLSWFITPITMVYGKYTYRSWGLKTNKHNYGAPPCHVGLQFPACSFHHPLRIPANRQQVITTSRQFWGPVGGLGDRSGGHRSGGHRLWGKKLQKALGFCNELWLVICCHSVVWLKDGWRSFRNTGIDGMCSVLWASCCLSSAKT